MEWLQVLTIASSTIGACWWLSREHRQEMKEFKDQYNKESKDFHGRLCALEEKYIQMMERFMSKK